MSAYYRVHPSIKKLWWRGRFTMNRAPWDSRKVAKLPLAYQKFYTEWIDSEGKETPVHWVPREGRWERNPETGEVKPIQNIPIQVNYPYEMNDGIWGGEGVIQGAVKKGKWRSPVPRFWSPNLFRSVVYSEVLDTYFSVVVTERALKLIDAHHGLDNYLMMTPAYDLKSLLALKLKRKIMETLHDKNFCQNDLEKQQEILDRFQEYMIPREELQWYALSIDEAEAQVQQLKEISKRAIPLKDQFRAVLFQQLKNERDNPPTAESGDDAANILKTEKESQGWMSKLNPFTK